MVSFTDVKYGNNIQEWLKDVAIVTGTMCDPNEPQTFQQAWWNPDKNAREKWHEAIRLELNKKAKDGHMERSKQMGMKCKEEINRKQMGLQDQKKWSLQSKIGCQRI